MSNGTEPVKDFVRGLDKKMKAKMLSSITMLSEIGPALRSPISAPLEDGIFELRAIHGSDITRILYFFYVGNKAVLTNGFVKKTQKTPKAEIKLAKKYREDYLRRYGNE